MGSAAEAGTEGPGGWSVVDWWRSLPADARVRGQWDALSPGAHAAIIAAIAVVLIGIIGIIVVAATPAAPADGSSCLSASNGEISAWVDKKDPNLPSGVSKGDVVSAVAGICATAAGSRTPQSFSNGLLNLAVGQAEYGY